MATQNVKDFNAVSSVNLTADSFLTVQNNELVRLNGTTTISGVNTISATNLNLTNRPTVNGTGVLLQGEVVSPVAKSAYFSWTPSSDQNITQNTDYFAALDNQNFNSNTNVFELVNSGSSSPAARVAIKETGYYRFFTQFYGYDLKNNFDFIHKLFRSNASDGALTQVRWLKKQRFASADSDGDSMESTTTVYVGTTGFYAFAFNSPDAGPYTKKDESNSENIPTISFGIDKL